MIQVRAAGGEVATGAGRVGDGPLAVEATLQDVRGGQEDALFVHGQLILGPNVVGSLHLLSPPARDAPRGDRWAKRWTNPHPGESTARRAAKGRNTVEEACPCGCVSGARIPVEEATVRLGIAIKESNQWSNTCLDANDPIH